MISINYLLTQKLSIMKKSFTLFCLIASVSLTFAQNPYLNEDKTGWANTFDTEADVLNDYVVPQQLWGDISHDPGDTVKLSWVDVDGNGALMIETNYEWDWGVAAFPISPDLEDTMDISSLKLSFKYKNFTAPNAAIVAAYRVYEDGNAEFGGELWKEEGVVYNSDEWTEIDVIMTPISSVLDAVYMLEVGFDGAEGSIIIDDLVFGDTTLVATGIDDYSANNAGITIYPNPASNYIQIMNAGEVFDVDVFNVTGQRILHAENKKRLDISSLENGIYFIEVQNGESRSVFKVMKH